MHILILPSWYPSSDEPIRGIFFREQAQALKRYGYQVGVIFTQFLSIKSLNLNYLKQYKYGKYLDDNETPTYQNIALGVFCRLSTRAFLKFTGIGKIFQAYIDQYGTPNIIHAHSALMGGVIAYHIKCKYNIPYVITEHDTIYYEIEKLTNLDYNLSKLAFSNASYRVVVSHHLGKTLEKHFIDKFYPWYSIPNILGNQFVKDKRVFSSIKSKLTNTNTSEFRFLNIALMNDMKGHAMLIESFSSEFRNTDNVKLYLGGNGVLLPKLKQMVYNFQMQKKIIFLGLIQRQDLVEEFLKCDVFVLPSLFETFGVVLIEAFACGKPVISTAIGGSEELVKPNNGLFVSPRDCRNLSKAMRYMYDNFDQYDFQKIRQECLSNFSEKVVINQISQIYSKLSSKSQS